MAPNIPSCACAGCGAPTSITTMTPASVTASTRLWFCTVTTNQVNVAKNAMYKRTCISVILPRRLKALSVPRFLSPLPQQRAPSHSPRQRSLPEAEKHPPGPAETFWPAPGSTATAALLRASSRTSRGISSPRKCRANPVRQWRRHDSNRLGRLGLFSNHQQHLGAAAFSRCAESLHLIHRYRIQVEVVDHRGHVSGLLPDDLRAGVL